jgi:hypothetical protein
MAVQTQIQTRRGTAATWTSTNPTLAAGEIGFESDTNKFKIGTGSTAWTALAYAANTSPLTTKGDLYTYSTDNTRLAVGNNGETLVADSSTSTGLRWQGTYEAGKNFLINGGMDCWQRGTSFTPGAFDNKYTADRWQFFVGTGSNTITQETTTVPTGARYALKWVSGAAGGTFGIAQSIETANTIPLAGKAITVQAQVTGTTGKTAVINVTYSTSTDVNPISVTTGIASSSTVTLTSGTFSTLTVTGTVPANAKTVAVQITSASTFANTEYITFGNVQLEVGSVATSFTRAGATIQGELAACQRYFQAGASPANNFINGATRGTGDAQAIVLLSPPMRAVPTITLAAAGQTTGQITFLTAAAGYPAVTGTHSAAPVGSTQFMISGTGYTAGWAAGQAVQLYGTGSFNVYTASAEL